MTSTDNTQCGCDVGTGPTSFQHSDDTVHHCSRGEISSTKNVHIPSTIEPCQSQTQAVRPQREINRLVHWSRPLEHIIEIHGHNQDDDPDEDLNDPTKIPNRETPQGYEWQWLCMSGWKLVSIFDGSISPEPPPPPFPFPPPTQPVLPLDDGFDLVISGKRKRPSDCVYKISPLVEVISFIESLGPEFNGPDEPPFSLHGSNYRKALNATANEAPLGTTNDWDFTLDSKEFRQMTRACSTICCRNIRLNFGVPYWFDEASDILRPTMSSSPGPYGREPVYHDTDTFKSFGITGYTPERISGSFIQGDGETTVKELRGDSWYEITVTSKFVIAEIEQIGLQLMGHPRRAPFAWHTVVMRMYCDQRPPTIYFQGSAVPTHYIYVNRRLVGKVSMLDQGRDVLRKFMAVGGPDLAPPGPGYIWDNLRFRKQK